MEDKLKHGEKKLFKPAFIRAIRSNDRLSEVIENGMYNNFNV